MNWQNDWTSTNLKIKRHFLTTQDMTIMSIEEAKARLQECNVLLKYMDFLQSNGFTDCGKGQIMGQTSFLREYLREERKEEQGEEENRHENLEERKKAKFDLPFHQRQHEYEKKQSLDMKNITDSRLKKMEEANYQNSNATNVFKTSILKQVGNLIDLAKDKTNIQQRKEAIFETKDGEYMDRQIKVSELSVKPTINIKTLTKDRKQVQGELDIDGQQETTEENNDDSLFNKIKKSTDVDNWQWQ
jgi:hypothetical protein